MAGTVTVASRERGAEAMELQRPVVEVGAERGDDAQPAVGRRDGVHQAVEERALFVVGREREELLELVDHEEELAARRGRDGAASDRCRFRRTGARRRARSCRLASATATRRRPSASSLNGAPPGSIVVTNHDAEPAISPARTRGSSPARTMLDLPLPEAPTTTMSRPRMIVVTEAIEQLVDDALPAEEVGGVGLVERAEALVRVHRRGPAARSASGHGGAERGDDVADRWAIGGEERRAASAGSVVAVRLRLPALPVRQAATTWRSRERLDRAPARARPW